MSYFMQPKQPEIDRDNGIVGSKPFSHVNYYITKDIMKVSDIEGALPQQIVGYTGTRPDKIISHSTKSWYDYGPSPNEQQRKYNLLTKEFGKPSYFNATGYKTDYTSPIKPVKNIGMTLRQTDARILPSQSIYQSNRATKRFIPNSKSQTKLLMTKTYK